MTCEEEYQEGLDTQRQGRRQRKPVNCISLVAALSLFVIIRSGLVGFYVNGSGSPVHMVP